MSAEDLDHLDRALVHALQIDGRAPFRRIGEVLGVSDQTVGRRYARLRERRALRVVALTDPGVVDEHQWIFRPVPSWARRCRRRATDTRRRIRQEERGMAILVVGARGAVGRHVVAGLLDAGHEVRATVRDLRTPAVDPRAEVVRADLTDPDSLIRALAGVSTVFLYATPGGAPVFADVAVSAGVEHVVVLSSGSVLLPWTVGNAIADEHREVERALAEAGGRLTPIRPLVLAGNALHWAPSIRRDRAVDLVHPESRAAPIHEADIAAVAVAALTGAAGDEASGLLTGGEVLTQRRQAELIGEALGEPIAVREIDEDRAREQFGRPGDPETEAILAFIARNLREEESLATALVREVLGREPLGFSRWVGDHLAEFR